MIKKILIGSSNAGKIEEFKFYINYFKIFQKRELVTPSLFRITEEPNENQNTFKGNANIKSKFFHLATGLPCLSDDSGFIIDDSKNFPGIRTARFAKDKGGFNNAIESLFSDKNDNDELDATFYCSLSYVDSEMNVSSNGKLKGKIIREAKGINGFAFDPFFKPLGSSITYGQMKKEEKMLNSHRFYAFQNLVTKFNQI